MPTTDDGHARIAPDAFSSDCAPHLIALGRALQAEGYAFVTVSPETHKRVEARACASGRERARSVRDVFGWSRPFEPRVLPPAILALAERAGVLAEEGGALRARIRFSTLGGRLFAHSAYPTVGRDAVFFGPDTYRYCDEVMRRLAPGPRIARVVDVGCGSGAGGIVAAPFASRVVLCDINPGALALARVNAVLAGLDGAVEVVTSDVLQGVSGDMDLVIANPPYMRDVGARAYRDGGGALGEGLALRILRESLERLRPGGRVVLYTGAAVVDGIDTVRGPAAEVCGAAGAAFEYRELDPDVFGEEIEQNEAYARVERIAAVAMVATKAAARA